MVNYDKILNNVDTLRNRRIRIVRDDGELSFFSIKDASNLIRYFTNEVAAKSVTYKAAIQLDGVVYDGFVDIDRNGWLIVRLNHDEEETA